MKKHKYKNTRSLTPTNIPVKPLNLSSTQQQLYALRSSYSPSHETL